MNSVDLLEKIVDCFDRANDGCAPPEAVLNQLQAELRELLERERRLEAMD